MLLRVWLLWIHLVAFCDGVSSPCDIDDTFDIKHSNSDKSTIQEEIDRHLQYENLFLPTSSSRTRSKRGATNEKSRIWKYGVIPYEIESNYSVYTQALFLKAMSAWEENTCISFVPRDRQLHNNYLKFSHGKCGCCSFVGNRNSGGQALSIGKNCDSFGIILHELGHAVGFWHEHTRPDRDKHVDILYENIQKGQAHNFKKKSADVVNSLGEPYDYESIMHYDSKTFSVRPVKITIRPSKAGMEISNTYKNIGQRIKTSKGDIRQTNLLYKCPACHTTFQSDEGIFSEEVSKNKMEGCIWRIVGSIGEKVRLEFTLKSEAKVIKSFRNTSASDNCDLNDSIEIRDGYYYKSPLIVRYCVQPDIWGSGAVASDDEDEFTENSYVKDTFVTLSNRLWLKYNANNGDVQFSAKYQLSCGGVLHSDVGTIYSPGWPNSYREKKECTWIITVKKGYTIMLTFHDFEIERHDTCQYDYLNIRDGTTKNSPLMAHLCGYLQPETMNTTGPSIRIVFRSDSTVGKSGFSASFKKVRNECMLGSNMCQHTCVDLVEGYECTCRVGFDIGADGYTCQKACGGEISDFSGVITSPHFPDNYPSSKTCIWHFLGKPGFQVTLNFTDFVLEGNDELTCSYDYLELRRGLRPNSPLQMRLCGSGNPNLISSEGNTLRLVFKSDSTLQKKGFRAVYTLDKNECAVKNGGCQHTCTNTLGSYVCHCFPGYTLHSNQHNCKEGQCEFQLNSVFGELESPYFPSAYGSKARCTWTITAKPGQVVRLAFRSFAVELNDDCLYDRLLIYDGSSKRDHLLGKLCGTIKPHSRISTGRKMFVKFFSDSSVQLQGFKAVYTQVCGGKLKASKNWKQIYSHANYGVSDYNNNLKCQWSITADDDNSIIELQILNLDIELEADCMYDNLEMFDGINNNQYVKKKGPLCGKFDKKNENKFITSGKNLFLKFTSDDTICWKGFTLRYRKLRPLLLHGNSDAV